MARLISFLAIVPALVYAAAVNTTCVTEPSCRCLPSDSCWPSKSEWTAFNKTVGGRLIATVPLGSVCHNSVFGSYNAQKCDQLKSVWDYANTHIASSSDPLAPFFANVSCDPFTAPSARCIVGTLVQYAVNASSSSDYLATIKFAQQNNIRLVIRNTGHDYYGKSSGTGGLALWTHFLKDISLVNYKQSYYTGKALKVGAGVQNGEALTFAHKNGLIVATGDGSTVGFAGGYSQGGGHGPVASKFGLAADQVLEWEVITSTGQHLVATPSQNTDLYWALSGGGGGTYAAVLSMTVRAYPDMPSSAANLTITNQGISDDDFYAAVQTFLTTLPSIVDAGATVVYLLAYGMFLVQPVNAPGVSKAQLQTLLNPTLSYLQEQNIAYGKSSSFAIISVCVGYRTFGCVSNFTMTDFHIDQFPTFLDSFNAYNPPPNITEYNIGGRLIPRTLLESQSSATSVVNAYRFINEAGAVISGVNVNVSNGTKVPNSVNPVWRSSITSNVIGV